MVQYINHNGELTAATPAHIPVWTGCEGIFETMRISNNAILFAQHHFKRLFDGLNALKFVIKPGFDADYFLNQIIELCRKNGHEKAARVRLAVYQKNNFSTNLGELEFQIECWELNDEYIFNETGLAIGIYPHATRQANELSLYKTTGYFPYRWAADYAKEQQLDDFLLQNTYKRICDSSISNIFWIKDGVAHTPPLSEGCVDGTMRNYLLEKMPAAGFAVKEEKLAVETLLAADEVFLTNVIRGIRSVNQLGKASYSNKLTREIFNKVLAPLTKG